MTFEVIKAEDGKFRWRLRDEEGAIVEVKPGKVMLPPAPRGENRRVRAAVQKVLAQRFEAQERDRAGAR